ncbi:MAG: ATP-dependent nuclease [Cellulosilyticaceae bacterium]
MNKNLVDKIKQQHLGNGWPQYLKGVTINNLRGIVDTNISFNFPITVLVGENGSRKTTILKTAACAYVGKEKADSYYPSNFFFNTQWDAVKNVSLEYFIRQGNSEKTSKLTKAKNWSYPEKRISRPVYFFDVARTLPIDATVGYARIVKRKTIEVETNDLNEEYTNKLGWIMGKNYTQARFASTDIDKTKAVGILKNEKIGEFSQFHQGAGEDCTLDLMKALQEIPKNSLVIIDEVEASLHPKAQRRLIQFIFDLSLEKKIQFILSTHSPYILEEVPEEARILLLDSTEGMKVVYAPSIGLALSRIDEVNHPELYLYCEDINAAKLIVTLITRYKSELLLKIQIVPAGAASVLKSLGLLCKGNKLPNKSWVVLDGDMEDAMGCIKLPGELAPEIMVFSELRDKGWPSLSGRFGIGAGDLFSFLEEAIQEEDHHKWCSKLGDRILKSRDSVWEVMVEAWVENCCTQEAKENFIREVEGLF